MNFKSGLTMLLLMTTLCLAFHAWTCSANPGLSVQISQKGFDYASEIATNKLRDFMLNTKIPDMSKGGSLQYSISNINVNSFEGVNNHVALIPSNQLRLTVSVNNIEISLNWRYSKKVLWFRIRDSGSARLRFSNTRLSIYTSISKTGTGGLDIKATSCSSSTDLKISTGNLILKILLFFFKSRIRRSIETQMCNKAIESINNKLAPRVSNYPLKIPFGGDYVFDYGFDSNPAMTGAYMKTNHKAAVYYKNGPMTIPFTPKALPSITGNNNMITFIISNYVFDTWLYAAYQKGIMKYTLSPDTIPDDKRELLQTSCPTSVCIGSLIPQIGVDFPNHTLGLEVSCSGRPQTSFYPGYIQIDIPAKFQFNVISTKMSKVSVLDINLAVKTQMSASMKDNQFFFAITKLQFTLGAINSKYVHKNDEKALRNAINPILGLLAKYFNDFGPNGLPLVLPDKTHVSNPSLRILKDAMILAADINIAAL